MDFLMNNIITKEHIHLNLGIAFSAHQKQILKNGVPDESQVNLSDNGMKLQKRHVTQQQRRWSASFVRFQ